MHRHYISGPLVYLIMFFPCPFQVWFQVSYKGNSPGVCSIVENLAAVQSLILRSLPFFNFFFFHFHLFDGVRFQYSQVVVIFPFSKRSDFFLTSVPSVICLFSLLINMAHFSENYIIMLSNFSFALLEIIFGIINPTVQQYGFLFIFFKFF